ncbi:MAG: hypothetical protein CSA29_01390 [Desulfobacterales bacterium]|nr:MAG: hypothetical protein CSA29_01390 [Desulfobacterales bacterium]
MKINMLKGIVGFVLLSLFVFSHLTSYADGAVLNFDVDWERNASLEAVERHEAAVKVLKARGLRLNIPNNGKPFKGESLFIFNAGITKKVKKYLPPGIRMPKINRIEIQGAQNEWESAQIGIWTAENIEDVNFYITDLIHQDGQNKIGGNGPNIRTYFVYNVLTKKSASDEVSADMDIDPALGGGRHQFHYEEEPVALVDLPQIDIQKGTCQALWLDIFIPKSAEPGIYSGQLKINYKDGMLSSIPLALTVLPFELDEAEEWARGAYISNFVDKKEAINLVEHGHTQVSWWTSGGYCIRVDNNRISADFSPYVDYLEMLDGLGMPGPHTVFLGGNSPKLINKLFKLLGRSIIINGRNVTYRKQYETSDFSPPFEEYLSQTLRQFHAQMKACGHESISAVLLDEPDHRPKPERLDWYNQLFSMVEKNVPELQTFGVFYHKGDEKKLSHHHHIWSTNCPSIEKYNACKKAGRKIFTYHGGFHFYASPGMPRFSIGIIPWVYDAAGTFYWAIWNHKENEREKDDIFSPLTFSGQSISIARSKGGSDTGPLSTLVHKGFREAVDDARYIITFEKFLNRIIKTQNNESAKAHRKWLRNVQETFRKKLYVRGGHVQNHKKWKDWHRPIASVKIKDLTGKRIPLDDLAEFSMLFRQDIIRRMQSLDPEFNWFSFGSK